MKIEKGLPSIFATTNNKGIKVEVLPKIQVNGKEYNPEVLVSKIAKEVSKDKGVFGEASLGTITFACFVLLETLHQAGFPELAEAVTKDPTDLQKFGLACAVGMMAGMILPEDLEFEQVILDTKSVDT